VQTSEAPTILKFGGTSVEDAAAFSRVVQIVRTHGGTRPVVVVSAISGFTDALLASVDRAMAGDLPAARSVLERHWERHRDIARRLLAADAARACSAELEDAARRVADLLGQAHLDGSRKAALRDEIGGHGERLAASLLASVLAAAGLPARYLDARRCIVTDGTHGRATPLGAETERASRAELLPLLGRGTLPVLGGYVARSASGDTTTLGRGGSDYTAALLGAALGASEIQIWTDVSGVLTADPRVVPSAWTIPTLSYAEAAELAYFGAKVLHPNAVQPAMERRIPVRICNSRVPDDPGTVVTAEAEVWPGTVKAIAHKAGITMLNVTSARMLGAYGFLHALFEVFDRHRTAVDVITTSEVSVSLTVEGESEALPRIAEELRGLGDVQMERGRTIICVVGEGLRSTPGVAARVFETVRDVNLDLISQGASHVNLTFVVDDGRAPDVVRRLHAALLEQVGAGGATARGTRAPARTAADPVALACELVDIPSANGDEAAVAGFLASLLRERGYEVELLEALPGRPNLLATTGAPVRVVLSTHLDTVGPYVGARDGGEFLYGRGACDAKGILAAQIAAAERLRADGVTELGLLFLVDEERGSAGARAANAHPRARECRYLINGEPTDNRLAIGSKGSLRVALRVERAGGGGHSAYPDRSPSAIDDLLAVLDDVKRCVWPRDDFFGDTTCNIGVVAGGTASNVIAAEARADLHIRLVTDAAPVRDLLERAVGGRAQIEYLSVTPPVRLTAIPGFDPCVVAFTTDVAHLTSWGTPLLLGPGSIHDAHTTGERISKAELRRGVDLYVRLVRALQDGPAAGAVS
jgi:aspartate kinase